MKYFIATLGNKQKIALFTYLEAKRCLSDHMGNKREACCVLTAMFPEDLSKSYTLSLLLP